MFPSHIQHIPSVILTRKCAKLVLLRLLTRVLYEISVSPFVSTWPPFSIDKNYMMDLTSIRRFRSWYIFKILEFSAANSSYLLWKMAASSASLLGNFRVRKRFLATSSRQLKNRTNAGGPIYCKSIRWGEHQQLCILTFFSTGIAWSNCLGKPSTRIKWRPLQTLSLILSWRIRINTSAETSSPLCTLAVVTESIIESETSLLNVSPIDKW